MNSLVQVVSFLVSFVYGIVIYLLSRFNKYILINKKTFFKLIITLVFIIDMVILYIYILYRINHGYFHIYVVTNVFYKKIKKICKMFVKKKKKK